MTSEQRESLLRLLAPRKHSRVSGQVAIVHEPDPVVPVVRIPHSERPISPFFVDPLPPVESRPYFRNSCIENTIWLRALLSRFPEYKFVESLKRVGKPRLYIFLVKGIKVAMTTGEAVAKLRKAGVRRW